MTPEETLVSFIGTNLDEKENLVDILQKDLGENNFEFSDLTSLSISFRVTKPKMDKVEALKIAHNVLMRFLD